MDIKEDIWFPTVIWKTELTDIDTLKIRDYIFALYSDDPAGNLKSNSGGWQSHTGMIDDERPPELEKLIVGIQDAVDAIDIKSGFAKLKISHYWFNINDTGHNNITHQHFPSILSGVFYIDIPKKEMGNICFYRDDDAEYYIPDKPSFNNRTAITSIDTSYAPKTGQLLLFPSWVKHDVKRNMSDKLRISMSFNIFEETVVNNQRNTWTGDS